MNFRGNIMAQFLHGKTAVCSVYRKTLKHFEKRLLQKILFFRSSCSRYRGGLFKNFLNFHWLSTCNLIEKGIPSQMFSSKFYEVFNNTFRGSPWSYIFKGNICGGFLLLLSLRFTLILRVC